MIAVLAAKSLRQRGRRAFNNVIACRFGGAEDQVDISGSSTVSLKSGAEVRERGVELGVRDGHALVDRLHGSAGIGVRSASRLADEVDEFFLEMSQLGVIEPEFAASREVNFGIRAC